MINICICIKNEISKSHKTCKNNFWSVYAVNQHIANNIITLSSISKRPVNSASGRESVLRDCFSHRFIQYRTKKYTMNRILSLEAEGFFHISRKFTIVIQFTKRWDFSRFGVFFGIQVFSIYLYFYYWRILFNFCFQFFKVTYTYTNISQIFNKQLLSIMIHHSYIDYLANSMLFPLGTI